MHVCKSRRHHGQQVGLGNDETACDMLDELQIPYEKKVVSAHRTPDLMFEYAETAVERGLKVIIAGAGGAAHLPGMVAAKTILPVIGVPVKSSTLNGLGFAALDCTNARRHSGCDGSNRQCRRHECRIACGTDSWSL